MINFARYIVVCWCLLAIPMTSGYGWAQSADEPASLLFQLEDNLIRVPVVVNGHSGSAVLDSGTGGLALDRSFALALGIKLGSTIGDAPGGGGPSAMYSISIADLRFGPEHLVATQGIALDLTHTSQSAAFPVEVLLGLPVFTSQPLRIDYPKRLITFLPANQLDACSDPIPFTLAGGSPSIAVTLQATPTGPLHVLHLIVDLGTRHNIAIIGGSFLSSPEGRDLIAHSRSQQIGTGTGGPMQGNLSQVSSLKVGGHTIRLPTLALTSDLKLSTLGIADGTLGVPLWADGTITFDYPHRLLCFSPSKP